MSFTEILSAGDAQRVSRTLQKLAAHGLRGGALTGGLAIDAQMWARGLPPEPRPLSDMDFVVDSLDAIPRTLADGFLLHHVHPRAAAGKMLLQLIDRDERLRIDLFRQFGTTLARAEILNLPTGPLAVVSLEDLVARTTSMVVGRLRQGLTVDRKHVRAFRRLAGHGEPSRLDAAWDDHRQTAGESFPDAAELARQLADRHPELAIDEPYSTDVTPCANCEDAGPFRRAPPEVIVEMLGYW